MLKPQRLKNNESAQDGDCKLQRAKNRDMTTQKSRKRLEDHHHRKEQMKNATIWAKKLSIVN